MKTSESISKVASALVKAQKAMDSAKKDAANPYFKSRYADLPAVIDAIKDALNDNGVVFLQPTLAVDGKNFVETILMHESGEFISGLTEVVCAKQNDPQAQGSAISYARRYGLQSMVGLKAADDDGEAAMSRPSSLPEKSSGPVQKGSFNNAVKKGDM